MVKEEQASNNNDGGQIQMNVTPLIALQARPHISRRRFNLMPHSVPYQITWSKTGRRKTSIKLVLDGNVILQAKKCKVLDRFIISQNNNFSRSSPSYQGTLKRFINSNGYTLLIPSTLNGQAKESEKIGITFFFSLENNMATEIRVALAQNDTHFPRSRHESLQRLAMSDSNSENISIIHSEVPARLSNGRLSLNFGQVDVIRSVKNFILRDENQRPILMIYKSANQQCTLKYSSTITPLIAFAISISIIDY